MKQPPAFQFYASDYLSSSRVQRMTLEAEGAYIRLLAYNWQDGSIPADIAQLAKMCKTTVRKMTLLWDEFLRDCFMPSEKNPDKLINRRLEEVRQSVLAFKAERSLSGSKGAAVKWKDHAKVYGSANGSAIAEPMAKDGSSSPSSVSSLQKVKPKKEAAPDDRREPLRTLLLAEYKKRRGKDLITDASTWKAFENLLRATRNAPEMTVNEIHLRWIAFLSSVRPFHREQGQPLRWFCQNINAFSGVCDESGNRTAAAAVGRSGEPIYVPES